MLPIVLVVGAIAAAGGIAAAWALNVYNSAPPLKSLKPVQKGRTSAIYTAEGRLIGYIQSENVRQPIKGSEIPQVLKNATVSIEDKDFWQHGALDYAGIARAAIKDIAAGGKPGGFSANGGVTTKLKMLAIEGAIVNHTPSLFD